MLEKLSGVWADTHSEEIKRGITIRLGYANTTFYKCDKCKVPECYGVKEICSSCNSKCTTVKKVSFVDAPGHETLMATMLSGAAIMNYAILVIAANEPCPQPQTKEHLMALNIIGVKNIIIIQNKIDLVTKEQAIENYNAIRNFIKDTDFKDVPIIAISAQHNVNIDILIEKICENFKMIERDLTKDPLMLVARSFDINKPGIKIKDIKGGVLGGALKQGKLNIKDKIEIRPGLKIEKENKTIWQPILSEIEALKSGDLDIKEVLPGGSIGLLTKLDPALVKSDNLIGNIAGLPGKMPPVWYEFNFKPNLLDRIVGAKDDLVVELIKKNETLMLNVNSAATIGIVKEIDKDKIHIILKLPVCAEKNSRVTISRQLGNRWRLIGWGLCS